jgi:mitochondrial cardiolipin hydrolase
MNEIEEKIQSCFIKGILDRESKRQIKELAIKIKPEDLSFLTGLSFKFFREYQTPENRDFLISCLQDTCEMIFSIKNTEPCVTDVCFTSLDDCTMKLIEFINTAKERLQICVFTISDDRLSREILKQHRAGVKVKIITDNEKLYDKGSDVIQLSESGIEVRIDNTAHHMHHKFAISDNKLVLTGSYNWTRSASEFNEENFIVLSDACTIKSYTNEFERLWKKSTAIANL